LSPINRSEVVTARRQRMSIAWQARQYRPPDRAGAPHQQNVSTWHTDEAASGAAWQAGFMKPCDASAPWTRIQKPRRARSA